MSRLPPINNITPFLSKFLPAHVFGFRKSGVIEGRAHLTSVRLIAKGLIRPAHSELLELTHSQMAQTPVARAYVYARALRLG
jgi:hypothetical protein